jgi:hypothetical protein
MECIGDKDTYVSPADTHGQTPGEPTPLKALADPAGFNSSLSRLLLHLSGLHLGERGERSSPQQLMLLLLSRNVLFMLFMK